MIPNEERTEPVATGTRWRRSDLGHAKGHWYTMAVRTLAAIAISGLGLAGAGCDSLLCPEYRSIRLDATGTAGSAQTRVWFELHEHRGGSLGEGQTLLWSVEVKPYPSAAVASVVMRAGTPQNPGAVLYDIPLRGQSRDDGKITRQTVQSPYQGAISFDDMWSLVQREPTFIEIVLTDGDAPIAIGPLQLTDKRNWDRPACS